MSYVTNVDTLDQRIFTRIKDDNRFIQEMESEHPETSFSQTDQPKTPFFLNSSSDNLSTVISISHSSIKSNQIITYFNLNFKKYLLLGFVYLYLENKPAKTGKTKLTTEHAAKKQK